MLSDDAAVMLRPLATYRRLAAGPRPSNLAILSGPLRLLLVIAAFVSWTTCGRLLPEHLLLAPLSWSFVPVIQAAAVCAVTLPLAGRHALRPALYLYFKGHLPWLLLLSAVGGTCLLAPEVWPVFRWLTSSGALTVAATLVLAWGVVLTAAMFRAGLGLPPRVAAAATGCFYALSIGCVGLYYTLAGQLLPILGVLS